MFLSPPSSTFGLSQLPSGSQDDLLPASISFLCTWESSGHYGKAPHWLFLCGPPTAQLCPHLVAVQLDPDVTQLALPTSLPQADSHSFVPLDSSGTCHTPKSSGSFPSRWAGGATEVSSPPFHHLGKVSSCSTLITLQIKIPQYSTFRRFLQHLMGRGEGDVARSARNCRTGVRLPPYMSKHLP